MPTRIPRAPNGEEEVRLQLITRSPSSNWDSSGACTRRGGEQRGAEEREQVREWTQSTCIHTRQISKGKGRGNCETTTNIHRSVRRSIVERHHQSRAHVGERDAMHRAGICGIHSGNWCTKYLNNCNKSQEERRGGGIQTRQKIIHHALILLDSILTEHFRSHIHKGKLLQHCL